MRINEMMDEYLLPHPLLDVSDVRFGITFERPDLQKMSVEERMEKYAKVGEKVGEKLSENQRKIIESIKENSTISIVDLAKNIGIAEKNIEENLKKLKDKGIIKRVGPAKGGYWEIIEK
jgi:ATP-dependent DNA helicase RecG